MKKLILVLVFFFVLTSFAYADILESGNYSMVNAGGVSGYRGTSFNLTQDRCISGLVTYTGIVANQLYLFLGNGTQLGEITKTGSTGNFTSCIFVEAPAQLLIMANNSGSYSVWEDSSTGEPIATGSGTFEDGVYWTGSAFAYLTDYAWNMEGFYYNESYTPPVASTLSFVVPTPVSGSTNNTYTNVIINVTSSSDNIEVYWGSTLVGNGSETSPFSFELNATLVPSTGTYTYNASNGANSAIQSWTYDIESPTLTLNPNNGFSAQNQTPNRYLPFLLLNLTITDDNQLYGLEINITHNGQEYFNISNESITGTSHTYFRNLSVGAWPDGNYNISIVVSDSHTARLIPDYDVTVSQKLLGFGRNNLNFKTVEGNDIDIEFLDDVTLGYQKNTDRYNFIADFGGNGAKTIVIKADKKITYLPNSDYPGHFVVYSGQGRGNWIDFAPYTPSNIVRVSDKEYRVIFNSLPRNVVFNSIGGLNYNYKNFQWVKSNLTTMNTTLLPTLAINTTNLLGYTYALEGTNLTVGYQYRWFLNGVFQRERNYSIGYYECYQEFANQSTSCGGLDTGSYEYSGSWNDIGNTADGDYSSYGFRASTGTSDMTITYIKPDNAIGAIWQIGAYETGISGMNRTNHTIPSTCYDLYDDKLVFLIQSVNSPTNQDRILAYCLSTTGSVQLFASDILVNVGLRVYEEGIFWNIENLTAPANENVLLDTFYANETDEGDNITFSARARSLGYYTPWVNSSTVFINNTGLDNCTSFDFERIQFLFRDLSEAAVEVNLSSSVDYTFSGLPTQMFSNSEYNISNQFFCTSLDLNVSANFTLQYGYPGGTGTYYTANTYFAGNLSNITIYIDTTAQTLITATVYDQYNTVVEDAYIHVQAYDFATNTYLPVGVYKTNFEGVTQFYGTLNTVFYRFLIYYPQTTLVETTSADFLYSNSINFQISLGGDVLDDYYTLEGISSTLTFNNDTLNFRYIFSDTSATITRGCLKIYKQAGLGDTLYNESCVSSTGGTILLGVANVSGTSYIAKSYVTLDSSDRIMDSLSVYFPGDTAQVIGLMGLLLDFILTVAFAFALTWSLALGVLLIPMPTLFLSFAGVIAVDPNIAIGIQLAALVVAIFIGRR